MKRVNQEQDMKKNTKKPGKDSKMRTFKIFVINIVAMLAVALIVPAAVLKWLRHRVRRCPSREIRQQ